MNTIKYANAQGKTMRVKIGQLSYASMSGVQPGQRKCGSRPRLTMAQADELMHNAGYFRAGRRWRRAA